CRRTVLVLTLFPEAVWNSVVSVATEDRQFLRFHFTITALTVDRGSSSRAKILLTDFLERWHPMTMLYLGGANLTQTNFSQYNNGSEILVSGQITDNNIETFNAEVIVISKINRVKYSETIPMEDPIEAGSGSHIQRLWAYLTVKHLLDEEVQSSGNAKEKVSHKPKEGEKPSGSRQGFSGSIFQFMSGQPGLPGPPAHPAPDYSGQTQTMGGGRGGGGVGLMLDAEEEQESYPANKIVSPLLTYFSWSLKINHKSDSVSLILSDKEMDITIGSTWVIIMFRWPVLRQHPTGYNIMGIIARPPVAYEEVQGTTMKLKIQDKEVDVSGGFAVDLSVCSASTVACWLLPLQSALQRELADFSVTQL
uniref:Uncharacterized protein n=1 Tax=Salmo trutta TaxID=8032 RepID=A0A673Y802_SALTR